MDNTNLFKHATKELTTDAFITWLFYFLDSKETYNDAKHVFFNDLLLRPGDHNKVISDIKVSPQQRAGKNGRIDLLLEFKIDNKDEKILFENKTSSSTNRNQLTKYKKNYANLYKYIYLKLAYINIQEKRLTKELGYECITSEKLSNALKKITHLHLFIEQYHQYLNKKFVESINSFDDNLFKNKKFEILEEGQAQEYLRDILFQKLEGTLSRLKIETENNRDGIPYSKIEFALKENLYGGKNEYLYWRIGKLNHRFCLRLLQYARIRNSTNRAEFEKKKMERRSILRDITADVNKKYNLNASKPRDGGVNESEIINFFLLDNDINSLVDAFRNFTLEVEEAYNNKP